MSNFWTLHTQEIKAYEEYQKTHAERLKNNQFDDPSSWIICFILAFSTMMVSIPLVTLIALVYNKLLGVLIFISIGIFVILLYKKTNLIKL